MELAASGVQLDIGKLMETIHAETEGGHSAVEVLCPTSIILVSWFIGPLRVKEPCGHEYSAAKLGSWTPERVAKMRRKSGLNETS